MAPTPIQEAIRSAIEKVQRHDLPLTPDNVRANIDVGAFTLNDLTDAMRKHINAQIPSVMKNRGMVIVDAVTRERKPFWDTTTCELEEQLRIKAEGNRFDETRIAADRIVIAFLKEKEKELGYEVYPGLFHVEIDRIYAMHGLTSP